MGKKAIKLSVDEELIAQARKIGPNISAFLENRLRELLNKELKNMRGVGFEPTDPFGSGP